MSRNYYYKIPYHEIRLSEHLCMLPTIEGALSGISDVPKNEVAMDSDAIRGLVYANPFFFNDIRMSDFWSNDLNIDIIGGIR